MALWLLASMQIQIAQWLYRWVRRYPGNTHSHNIFSLFHLFVYPRQFLWRICYRFALLLLVFHLHVISFHFILLRFLLCNKNSHQICCIEYKIYHCYFLHACLLISNHTHAQYDWNWNGWFFKKWNHLRCGIVGIIFGFGCPWFGIWIQWNETWSYRSNICSEQLQLPSQWNLCCLKGMKRFTAAQQKNLWQSQMSELAAKTNYVSNITFVLFFCFFFSPCSGFDWNLAEWIYGLGTAATQSTWFTWCCTRTIEWWAFRCAIGSCWLLA